MHIEPRTLALALGLGATLAACGGSDGSDNAPPSGPASKALPAPNTAAPSERVTSRRAAQSPDTPAPDAGDATEMSAPRTTKDVPASDAIRTAADGKSTEIRGDLLIQLLLSRIPARDAQGHPMLAWLDPEMRETNPIMDGGVFRDRLLGPALLVDEDITSDARQGGYRYHLGFEEGPIHGPLHIPRGAHTAINHAAPGPAIHIGLSQSGMSRTAVSPPVTGTLEISQQLIVLPSPDDSKGLPHNKQEQTLESEQASRIDPKAWYPLDWSHQWSGNRTQTYEKITWSVKRPDKAGANQFDTCMKFSHNYADTRTLCERQEVPAGWSSGQPLKHIHWAHNNHYFSELGDNTSNTTWNDTKGSAPISRTELKSTPEPINRLGISGSVLSALLDIYSPRGAGMSALPQRAGAADDVYSTTPVTQNPAFVSLQHESRPSAYASGDASSPGYAPASGSYLYQLSAGTWQSDAQPRSAGKGFPSLTLAMHPENDAQKGLILPRWTELNLQKQDEAGNTVPVYQGKQDGDGSADKTIAQQDLIIFGSAVQAWKDPYKYAQGTPPSTVDVSLTIEHAEQDPRSVDLCWNVSTTPGVSPMALCTTTRIPQEWAPGQPLLPHDYHMVYDRTNKMKLWNTKVAH